MLRGELGTESEFLPFTILESKLLVSNAPLVVMGTMGGGSSYIKSLILINY